MVRKLIVVTAAALVSIGLAGCRTNVGTAASVDGKRISDSDVTSYVTAKGLLFNFDVPPALGRRVDAFLPCDLLVNVIAADGALKHCRQSTAPK